MPEREVGVRGREQESKGTNNLWQEWKGVITTVLAHINMIPRFYKQLYVNAFKKLDKMNNFLEKCNNQNWFKEKK